ncbi:MAG: AdeC/AdeK/OprM family multidrug efflux complex outer membrane factor [Candidatus Ratteibacteria bacterium]|jgi:multidrug efflux system outer membrane protein
MTRNALSIIFILICLAGCSTLAPKYSQPEAPVPAQWPEGSASKVTAGSQAANIGWREFYVDEQLQKVIALALENNRDLRTAALNIEKARALYRIQRAELFPTVSATGLASRQHLPGEVAGTPKDVTIEQDSVSLGVSTWEIDFFGRVRSLKESALEQYLATEQARRSAQISLVAEVANVYMTLAIDREDLQLAEETLENQKASYDLIQRRFKSGISSEIDPLQARTRIESARVDVARYTGQVVLDENALNLLTGSKVPPELLPGRLETGMTRNDIIAGLPSEVLLRRPDILQAENQLKAANANIGAARAAFFPRIALTGSAGTIGVELSDLFKSGSNTWTFAPQIVLPIFDSGARKANLKAAQVDFKIYLARYEKVVQSAFKEVADALSQRVTLDAQLAAQESLVQASREVFRLAGARYEHGIDSYLSILDAQRSLYAAQQGLLAIRLAKSANLVTLYKVLGGGASQSSPPKTGQSR